MATASASWPAADERPRHPRGLVVLFFTEMWERFGFYTMNAIYVLYMQKRLGWSDAVTHNFWGFFIGAVYVVPIVGGWLGDQVLGRKAIIRLGALLMVVGYTALALSSREWVMPFYVGLALVAIGTGFFKANISVLVGQLYPDGSPLKDSAFNIFYMGVNLGATLSPLAATWIHEQFDSYNLSFAAAAVGMLLSIVIFQAGRRHLVPAQGAASSSALPVRQHEGPAPWTREDSQRVTTLVALIFIAIFFWVGFYQNGDVLTLFAARATTVYRYLKAETYQVFGPGFILLLTPLLVWVFGIMRRRKREPSSATKISLGVFIAAMSLVVMALAGMAGGDHDRNDMSPAWLVSSYLLMSLGEIMVSPMGLSLVSKVAPARIRGLMMGFWFSATAAGGLSSGILGRLYSSTLTHHAYFLLIAGLLSVGAALAVVFRKRLDRFTA